MALLRVHMTLYQGGQLATEQAAHMNVSYYYNQYYGWITVSWIV